MDAAAHNQPLRALWANRTPAITSVPLDWTVVRSKVPLADSTDLDKRKPTHQLKSNGIYKRPGSFVLSTLTQSFLITFPVSVVLNA